MRILFLFPRDKAYDSVSVREKPSGGTEKAVIFLGEAFKKLGHEVEWLTTPEDIRNGPDIMPDVVITQIAELLEQFPEAKKVWWCHHFADQPVIQINAAYGRCFADRIVTLSECQSQDFKNTLKLDSITIGHGVWLDELDIRPSNWKDPYRLIYASTPFRGLEKIPELFREIKAREPRATIAICSSMATYGLGHEDEKYQYIFNELRDIEGVELLGALNQRDLYAEYARASIFFYPSIWPETYCIAMDEAIAHGCIPVVTRIGALSERAAVPSCVDGPDKLWAAALACIGSDYQNLSLPPKDWLEVAKAWEEQVFA